MALPERMSPELFSSLEQAIVHCLDLPSVQARIDALRLGACAIRTTGIKALRAFNDAAPVNQLPDDLLIRMLSYTSLMDRASASVVCQRWRSVVNGSTLFNWNHHDPWFTDIDGLSGAAAWLTRDTDTPVPVTLLIQTEYNALGDLLHQHLYHLGRLVVHIQPPFDTLHREQPPVRPLLSALQEPAPTLEMLELWNSNFSWLPVGDVFLPGDFLACSAPVLRSLSLRGFALLDHPYPALAAIQKLYLSQCEVYLSHFLSYYPALEQLHIEALSVVGSGETVAPQHLRLLRIPGTRQAVEIVLTQLALSRPLTVWTEAREDNLLFDVLATAPKKDITSLAIYLDIHCGQPAYALSYSSGPSWVIGMWPVSPEPSHPLYDAEIMAAVRELALHELVWPLAATPAPAPRLTHLELVLYCFAFPANDEELRQELAGLFVGSRDAGALQCPALEEISVFFPGAPITQPQALTVDVFDLLDFMETRLRFSAAPLPLLTLRNVSLYDPAHGRGMELLTARVRRLEYRGFTEPQIPYIHQKNRSLSWVYSMMG